MAHTALQISNQILDDHVEASCAFILMADVMPTKLKYFTLRGWESARKVIN